MHGKRLLYRGNDTKESEDSRGSRYRAASFFRHPCRPCSNCVVFSFSKNLKPHDIYGIIISKVYPPTLPNRVHCPMLYPVPFSSAWLVLYGLQNVGSTGVESVKEFFVEEWMGAGHTRLIVLKKG